MHSQAKNCITAPSRARCDVIAEGLAVLLAVGPQGPLVALQDRSRDLRGVEQVPLLGPDAGTARSSHCMVLIASGVRLRICSRIEVLVQPARRASASAARQPVVRLDVAAAMRRRRPHHRHRVIPVSAHLYDSLFPGAPDVRFGQAVRLSGKCRFLNALNLTGAGPPPPRQVARFSRQVVVVAVVSRRPAGRCGPTRAGSRQSVSSSYWNALPGLPNRAAMYSSSRSRSRWIRICVTLQPEPGADVAAAKEGVPLLHRAARAALPHDLLDRLVAAAASAAAARPGSGPAAPAPAGWPGRCHRASRG